MWCVCRWERSRKTTCPAILIETQPRYGAYALYYTQLCVCARESICRISTAHFLQFSVFLISTSSISHLIRTLIYTTILVHHMNMSACRGGIVVEAVAHCKCRGRSGLGHPLSGLGHPQGTQWARASTVCASSPMAAAAFPIWAADRILLHRRSFHHQPLVRKDTELAMYGFGSPGVA